MAKKIWILTLFPEFFAPIENCGVVGKALRGERGAKFDLQILRLGDFSPKDFKGVDDAPYGGGQGMVMRADVLKAALDEICKRESYSSIKESLQVVYTGPRGRVWSNEIAKEFSNKLSQSFDKDIVFICGRYEGIDERFLESYVDETYSLGDFILSGGDIAVLAFLDSAMRFCPDVLGNKQSAVDESFASDLIEYPYYTRPIDFEGKGVPKVLLDGHHAKQAEWKMNESIELTKKYRPDLYKRWKEKGNEG